MKYYTAILFALLLPNLLAASPAENEARQTIAGIYQLEKSFDQLLKQDDDEDRIKKEFQAIIHRLTTGELKNRWDEFIKNTPIRSTFYRVVFESMTPVKGFEVSKMKVSGSRADAEILLQVTELYAPSIDMISLDELFAKYKITNMTIPEIIAQLPTNSLAELVEYKITSKRQDSHKLKFVNGKWKIRKIDQRILSSTIEMKVPKKTK